MPPFRKPTLVTLRRQQPNQAWGFRLGGGAEIGQPFQIQKVTPGSLAYMGGLSEGDELVRIGNISLRGLTHDEVQQIILRCSLCIDLFVIRDNGNEIEPRFVLVRPEIVNKQMPEGSPQIFTPSPQPPQVSHLPPATTSTAMPLPYNGYFPNESANVSLPVSPANNNYAEPKQVGAVSSPDFNRSPRPFETSNDSKAKSEVMMPPVQSAQIGLTTPVVPVTPGSPIRDTRVFGVSGRGSKSPIMRLNSLSRENSISPLPPVQASPPAQAVSHTAPTTPAAISNNFSFFDNDLNNNPVNAEKVFGLPARSVVKPIEPLGNHGVQPVTREKKYFGLNPKQRHNSFSCDRDWKASLPIVNIPNTDQLLPSQTKQMQTYINQVPPTEKNLRPTLIGIERRRIRPIWPPPLPNRGYTKTGICVEGRDSPHTKMYNWPPRAQSVDRDFGYGERFGTPPPSGMRGQTPDRCESPFYSGRVHQSTRMWPPLSNATPAGKSGYMSEEEDEENYAYKPGNQTNPGSVRSHIPPTYRPPPGTQYVQVLDF